MCGEDDVICDEVILCANAMMATTQLQKLQPEKFDSIEYFFLRIKRGVMKHVNE